jgi:hypothetical protein
MRWRFDINHVLSDVAPPELANGDIVGLVWMTGYWAMVLPPWVNAIVRVLAAH